MSIVRLASCDRCGSREEMPTANCSYTINDPSARISGWSFLTLSQKSNHIIKADLCSLCTSEVEKWFNGLEEKQKEENKTNWG